jgi:hypothetical protein
MSQVLQGTFVVGRETLPKAPSLKLASPQLNARKRGVRSVIRAQSVAEVERPALKQNASKKASSSFIVGHYKCLAWAEVHALGTTNGQTLTVRLFCRLMYLRERQSCRHRYNLARLPCNIITSSVAYLHGVTHALPFPRGMTVSQDLPSRPRRNRRSPSIRGAISETSIAPANLILPVFIHDGEQNIPIASMPGVDRLGWRHGLLASVAEARSYGVNSVVLFPKASTC